MRALLDTNIVLDLLMKREPFAQDAAAIWEANRQGRFDGYVSAIKPFNWPERFPTASMPSSRETRRTLWARRSLCFPLSISLSGCLPRNRA